MKKFLICCMIAAPCTLASLGCGEPQPTNIMEDTDQAKLAEYEAMIEAESNAQTDQGMAEPEN